VDFIPRHPRVLIGDPLPSRHAEIYRSIQERMDYPIELDNDEGWLDEDDVQQNTRYSILNTLY